MERRKEVSGMRRNMLIVDGDVVHRVRAGAVGASGGVTATHQYYLFGKERTGLQEAERRKFTGHERDFANPAGDGDDLDYMHARHFSAITGRFLSVDPLGGSPRSPQSWNRYAYVTGNPSTRSRMILAEHFPTSSRRSHWCSACCTRSREESSSAAKS